MSKSPICDLTLAKMADTHADTSIAKLRTVFIIILLNTPYSCLRICNALWCAHGSGNKARFTISSAFRLQMSYFLRYVTGGILVVIIQTTFIATPQGVGCFLVFGIHLVSVYSLCEINSFCSQLFLTCGHILYIS